MDDLIINIIVARISLRTGKELDLGMCKSVTISEENRFFVCELFFIRYASLTKLIFLHIDVYSI